MNKKVAIMQPYFLPYIGYWQLMTAVDQFVVYDNIQYTKKGWVNRNRFLRNGKAEIFSLPLKKDSSFLDVRERFLIESFDEESKKLIRQIEGAYKKAKNFDAGIALFKDCIQYKDKNLFGFIYHSILKIKEYLEIDTEVVISSTVNCNHELNSTGRVKAICHALQADEYINPIGGVELYSKEDFLMSGIALGFHNSKKIKYLQFDNYFEPWLSILDIIMFVDNKDDIKEFLKSYEIQ